jgi:hypothetical protein
VAILLAGMGCQSSQPVFVDGAKIQNVQTPTFRKRTDHPLGKVPFSWISFLFGPK